jgi:hypothetical protein
LLGKCFDNHVTKSDDKNHLLVNEWEYVICGSTDDEVNYRSVRKRLFFARNVLNLAAIYKDPAKVELIVSIAETISPGPLGIATQALIAEAWAALETEEDLVVILTDIPYGYDSKANGKKVLTKIGIPQLRIAKQGTMEGNPNGWCDADATSFTLETILSTNKTYVVGQCRLEASLAFDGYKFANLPGSENEGIATVGGVTVKMSQYGDGDYLEKKIRFDLPFGAGLMDPRLSTTTYWSAS